MNERRCQIAVVGAGARGETFARQLGPGTRRAELFGVCDLDKQRLEQFLSHCAIEKARRFHSVDELLQEDELDAVIVTTPEFAHADVAVAAMRAGKHVYLEKPIAHTLADSRRILEAHRDHPQVTTYLGFNLRASIVYQKLKEVIASGLIGQVVHVDGCEQLSRAHGASFMRRFHRQSSRSGGLLNHKCSHDLDIMLWLVGHEHRVRRIASFGGCNVFTPDKQPAETCSTCPTEIYDQCGYKAARGYVFPVGAKEPIYHPDRATYGGDLCVYSADKDLVDNQTVILEWEHGVRGSFNLQMFQAEGCRISRVWGDRGLVEMDTRRNPMVRVTLADSGDTIEHNFQPRTGGHGGTDALMIERFLDAIEGGGPGDSGLAQGHAATLVALKADEARHGGTVVTLTEDDYTVAASARRATAGAP